MLCSRRHRPAPPGGFTLVEVLLTVVIILLLLGAVVFQFSAYRPGGELDEGVGQMEALFRFVRAHAESSGRLVRVEFPDVADDGEALEAGENSIRVTWESDPVGAPGVFVPLAEALPFVERLNEIVWVNNVRLGGGSERPAPAAEDAGTVPKEEIPETEGKPDIEGGTSGQMAPIVFYPDGTGDSAEVVLASRREDDLRRFVVRLVGVTGSVRARLVPDPAAADAPASAEVQPAPATEATK